MRDNIPTCEQLNIPLMNLPEWYKEFSISNRTATPPHTPQSSPIKPPSSKKTKFGKRACPNPGRSPYVAKGSRNIENAWIRLDNFQQIIPTSVTARPHLKSYTRAHATPGMDYRDFFQNSLIPKFFNSEGLKELPHLAFSFSMTFSIYTSFLSLWSHLLVRHQLTVYKIL